MESESLRQSIRTFVAVFIAFLLCQLFDYENSYWMILSSGLMIQLQSSDLFWKRNWHIMVTGLLAGIAALFGGVVGKATLFAGFYLFWLSFICVFVCFQKREFFLSAVLINIFGVLSTGLAAQIGDATQRFDHVFVGALIAVVVNVFVLPESLCWRMKWLFVRCLEALAVFQKNIFAMYLQGNYSENHFFYEKYLNQQRRFIIYLLYRLKKILPKLYVMNKDDFSHCITRLDQISVLFNNFSQLRYRIADHSTFEFSRQELQAVSTSISHVLTAMASSIMTRRTTGKLFDLDEKIQALEIIYQNALQVVAAEPNALLFFIYDLYVLAKELTSFRTDIMKLKNENINS